jgi:hypothetical protein
MINPPTPSNATAPPPPGPVARVRRLLRKLTGRRRFEQSGSYWEERYRLGGNSGSGSYGRLAAFKAEVLNTFVEREGVASLIEFGCGDGNQLSLAHYPDYTGLDVAREAVRRCEKRFAADGTKRFVHYDQAAFEAGRTTKIAHAALSLDVIFHLVEDSVYERYMTHLFDSAKRFVIVYSSNRDGDEGERAKHVRHRRFTDWIETHRPDWSLKQHIPNRYPESIADGGEVSFADFYVYERAG